MAANETNEDGEVYDSWEDMEDAGILDKKLKAIENKRAVCENSVLKGSFAPTAVTGIIFQGDESLRTQYVPPEPQVKILKRPQGNNSKVGDLPVLNGDSKPRQPVKTLQQREQEYAEARLRILGEARSPEELTASTVNVDDRVNKIQTKFELLKTAEASTPVVRLPKGPDGSKGFNERR